VKEQQNRRKSLRRLKPTVGCNVSKRRRRITPSTEVLQRTVYLKSKPVCTHAYSHTHTEDML
jgi:hypothetical protein